LASIVKWVQKKSGPPSIKVSNCEKFRQKIDKSKDLNFVYFGAFEGELFNLFIEAAKSNEVYKAYHAPASCTELMGSQSDSLNIYRPFEDKHIVYFVKNLRYEKVIEWLADQSLPEVVEMTIEYVDMILSEDNPKNALVLFTDFKDDVDVELTNKFYQVAKELRHKLLFVTSGTQGDDLQKLFASDVGVIHTPTIRLVVQKDGELLKYMYEGDLL
jgi:hypothetical protein